MTHTTEQERADFEKAWRERPIYMGGVHQKEVAYIWWMQAARRAPAVPVPQGWKLVPIEPTLEMQQAALKHIARQHQTRDVYAAMLAAAPQPPEAAPVQLPEPVCFAIYDSQGFYETLNTEQQCVDFCNHYNERDARLGGGLAPYTYEKLYPEQQVRQLLAAHTIKEQST